MRISDWSSDVCSSDLNILIRELSTHLANPGPRRDHVVSGGETPGVAAVGDAHEPQEPTRNDLATPHDRQPAPLAARAQPLCAQGNERALRPPVVDAFDGRARPPDADLRHAAADQIGRAHVCTPDTNSDIVCHLLLETT